MRFLDLKTPQDMLEKTKREYFRLQEHVDVDNVFNFFVSANHIKDYIEKNNAVHKDLLKALFDEQDMKDCRDLCDKAKHLRLTYRADPDTHKWSGTVGGSPLGAVPLGGDGGWELWSDGRAVSIIGLAKRVMQRWEKFFKENGLCSSRITT